jgi:acetylornithine deacetylase/succinyl-diaminopimelate desuccinylase-like protein
VLPKEEEMRMHGLNERISVDGLIDGLKATERICKTLASYAPPA